MVSVSVVATAGALSSDPMRGADVEVLNSAPTTPAMGIEPNAPATVHDLVCRITTDSIDDDGDEVRAATKTAQSIKVPMATLTASQRWQAVVMMLALVSMVALKIQPKAAKLSVSLLEW